MVKKIDFGKDHHSKETSAWIELKLDWESGCEASCSLSSTKRKQKVQAKLAILNKVLARLALQKSIELASPLLASNIKKNEQKLKEYASLLDNHKGSVKLKR